MRCAKITRVLGQTPKQRFTRDEVLRLLSIGERRLRSWEKQDLVPAADSFGFSDIIAMRTLLKLREERVSPARIRRALASLREKLRDVANPLTELKVFSDGKRLGVQIGGRRMEAISGQLLLDFDREELNKLLSFPSQQQDAEKDQQQKKKEAERWFQTGLELEQRGAPLEQVVEAYTKAAALDAGSAGALVNLGTIYYNARSWKDAEDYYTKALLADPEYPLAHFNLGNLYDEMGDRAKALTHYQAAIHLHPGYADAHYNLALLYQSTGQLMKAVRHWKDYLRLDPSSSWAVIARRELGKLRKAHVIRGARDAGPAGQVSPAQ
jgi:tetratricopeptide (TPR) repeat protein